MAKRNRLLVLCVVLFVAFAFGCGGPEEKKLKFLNKGKELYEKGQYTEAKLEFKNAIQIDPKYADAYYMLGMVEMKSGNPRGAYGSFHEGRRAGPEAPEGPPGAGPAASWGPGWWTRPRRRSTSS